MWNFLGIAALCLFSMAVAFFIKRFFFSNRIKVPAFSSKDSFKMVLLIRSDIGMTKGKAAAQCAHAAIAAYRTASVKQPVILKEWEDDGQAKVTLKVENEADLVDLIKKAREAGLIGESIKDAGRTQLAAGTRTVGVIGPGPAKLIDLITGHLKLY
jgi:peptidyl-tRNA hydrolase, PTH2 family